MHFLKYFARHFKINESWPDWLHLTGAEYFILQYTRSSFLWICSFTMAPIPIFFFIIFQFVHLRGLSGADHPPVEALVAAEQFAAKLRGRRMSERAAADAVVAVLKDSSLEADRRLMVWQVWGTGQCRGMGRWER
jgi:hypothetical protein